MDIKKTAPIIVIAITAIVLFFIGYIIFFNPSLLRPLQDTIEKKEVVILTESFTLPTEADDPSKYQLSDKLINTGVEYPLTRAYIVRPVSEEDVFEIADKFDFTSEDKESSAYEWENNDSFLTFTPESRFITYTNLTRSGFNVDFKSADSKKSASEAINSIFNLNENMWDCKIGERDSSGDSIDCYLKLHGEYVYTEQILTPMGTFKFGKNGNLQNANIYLINILRTEKKEMPSGYTPLSILTDRNIYKKVFKVPGGDEEEAETPVASGGHDGEILFSGDPIFKAEDMTIDNYDIKPFYYIDGNAVIDSIIFSTKELEGETHYVISPYLEASDMTLR